MSLRGPHLSQRWASRLSSLDIKLRHGLDVLDQATLLAATVRHAHEAQSATRLKREAVEEQRRVVAEAQAVLEQLERELEEALHAEKAAA